MQVKARVAFGRSFESSLSRQGATKMKPGNVQPLKGSFTGIFDMSILPPL